MRRGTTPVISLEVDFDLTGWHLFVTFKNGLTEITFENDALDIFVSSGVTTVNVLLSQLQTLSFKAGTKCEVQIRACKNEKAIASDIQYLNVEGIILNGVISG